ncbi:sce7726 family protein [Shewanella oncorhynchi]|uniref:sce7726 family protein n=1 Tax=Shewanella oncorhynchi TaxID=2726434 RepID=UPI003D79D435
MLEDDIKALLINELSRRGQISSDSLIISELTVGGFSRRVDLVFARPKELIAYEVKSSSDNLNRLSGQIKDYLRYFDKVVVVVDSVHIKNTLKIAPKNVAVWELRDGKFIIKRRGVKTIVKDREILSSFLTSADISKLVPSEYKNFSVLDKRKLVSDRTNFKVLRGLVYELLYRKFSATTSKLMERIDAEKSISSIDIEQLSLYIEERRTIEREKAQKSKLWKIWADELSISA